MKQCLMLSSLLVLGACDGAPPCVSKDRQVTHDPGSDRYAISEKRYCHGSTDPMVVVRVGRASRPREEVEVFVARGKPDMAMAYWISPTWTAHGRLEIAHTVQVHVLKQATRAEGAAISYRVSAPLLPPAVP